MPSAIQEAPWGLLSLIGAKTNGQTPNALSDTVAPTIDITKFEISKRVIDSATTTGGVLTLKDEGLTIVVPEGKIWWIQQITGFFNASALATNISLGLLIRYAMFGQNLYVASKDQVAGITAATRVVLGYTPPQPLLIPGGGIVALKLNDNTYTGSVTGGLQVAFVELDA